LGNLCRQVPVQPTGTSKTCCRKNWLPLCCN
jgi:hypothetical protein